MTPFARLTVLALVACVQAQYEERAPRYISSDPKEQASTPVPILKQINRHNEDGSYTYGYEAADGSFKIETKTATGEVKGKYGYKDDTGKVRVIEYGANKYGFQPAGEGITVAPPTLVDESTRDRPEKQQGNRNQQYRPAPAQAIDYDYNDEPAPAPRPAPRPAARPAQQAQFRAPPPPPQQPQFRAPPPPPQSQFRAPPPTQQPQYRPAPQSQQQQQYRPTQGPAPPKPAFFAGASPAPAEDNNNFFNPEPQRRQYQPKQDFQPAPQFQQFSNANDFSGPAPTRQPQFQPQNNFPPQQRSQPYSMLDQLLKEYSLPSNGVAPLHDITFGSY